MVLAVLGALLAAPACEQQGGLKPALRPAPGQKVAFYRIQPLRCPYWVSAFKAEDGQKGGAQCVSRAALRELCKLAECEAKPGTPNNLPPGLINHSKGGIGHPPPSAGAN